MDNIRDFQQPLMQDVHNHEALNPAQHQYDMDKQVVLDYIADINSSLENSERADPIKTVLSLPDLLGGDASLKATKDIIQQYAQAIRDHGSNDPELDETSELLQRNVQQAINIANDGSTGLGAIRAGHIRDQSLSKEFVYDTYQPKQYNVGGTQVSEQTNVFTRGITSKDAKKVRDEDVHGHFLGNPMLRSVQAGDRDAVNFARMGALTEGQGSLFAKGVDKMQGVNGVEEHDRRKGHLDLRLVDPIKEKRLYDRHCDQIEAANATSGRDGAEKIQTCTLPVNSNDMSKTEMLGRGLKVAWNKHPVATVIGGTLAVAGLAAATFFTGGAFGLVVAAVGLGSTLGLGGIGSWSLLNSKQNKFKDEWNEAQQGIDQTLSDLEQRIDELEDGESATELYTRAREIYDRIYDGEDGKATKAANGFDGLMLGVLMMKLADEVGMTTSEGCKSNKDRGTMLDFMMQAQEVKWAKNGGDMSENGLLDLSKEEDQEILRNVVGQSDTRNTGQRNTGLSGNMYFCRNIGNVLGDQYNGFVGDALKGSA